MNEYNLIQGEKFIHWNDDRIHYDHSHEVNLTRIYNKIVKDNIKVVVTHNSDHSLSMIRNIDIQLFDEIIQKVKWFSVNCDILHENAQSLPIGLENNEWHKDLNKYQKILTLHQNRQPKHQKITCMFSLKTNPKRKITLYYYQLFSHLGLVSESTNGSNFDEYLVNLFNSKFCICPCGNGYDTHRIWEAIYLGAIPVIENEIALSYYKQVIEPLYMFPLAIANLDHWLCNPTGLNTNDDKIYTPYWRKLVHDALL